MEIENLFETELFYNETLIKAGQRILTRQRGLRQQLIAAIICTFLIGFCMCQICAIIWTSSTSLVFFLMFKLMGKKYQTGIKAEIINKATDLSILYSKVVYEDLFILKLMDNTTTIELKQRLEAFFYLDAAIGVCEIDEVDPNWILTLPLIFEHEKEILNGVDSPETIENMTNTSCQRQDILKTLYSIILDLPLPEDYADEGYFDHAGPSRKESSLGKISGLFKIGFGHLKDLISNPLDHCRQLSQALNGRFGAKGRALAVIEVGGGVCAIVGIGIAMSVGTIVGLGIGIGVTLLGGAIMKCASFCTRTIPEFGDIFGDVISLCNFLDDILYQIGEKLQRKDLMRRWCLTAILIFWATFTLIILSWWSLPTNKLAYQLLISEILHFGFQIVWVALVLVVSIKKDRLKDVYLLSEELFAIVLATSESLSGGDLYDALNKLKQTEAHLVSFQTYMTATYATYLSPSVTHQLSHAFSISLSIIQKLINLGKQLTNDSLMRNSTLVRDKVSEVLKGIEAFRTFPQTCKGTLNRIHKLRLIPSYILQVIGMFVIFVSFCLFHKMSTLPLSNQLTIMLSLVFVNCLVFCAFFDRIIVYISDSVQSAKMHVTNIKICAETYREQTTL